MFTKGIRHFTNKICLQFNTIETPSETAANLHAEATRIKKGKPASTRGAKRMAKTFNINTPKFHSIACRQVRLQALNQIPHFMERDTIPEDLLD